MDVESRAAFSSKGLNPKKRWPRAEYLWGLGDQG